jgi:hypothetical protein
MVSNSIIECWVHSERSNGKLIIYLIIVWITINEKVRYHSPLNISESEAFGQLCICQIFLVKSYFNFYPSKVQLIIYSSNFILFPKWKSWIQFSGKTLPILPGFFPFQTSLRRFPDEILGYYFKILPLMDFQYHVLNLSCLILTLFLTRLLLKFRVVNCPVML